MVLMSIQPSHDIHSFYLTLHESARNYKERVKIFNIEHNREGREPRKAKSVEMDNFQDPQVHIHALLMLLLVFP